MALAAETTTWRTAKEACAAAAQGRQRTSRSAAQPPTAHATSTAAGPKSRRSSASCRMRLTGTAMATGAA
eukprot:7489451-Alexandrium_andersonii.AAC.1